MARINQRAIPVVLIAIAVVFLAIRIGVGLAGKKPSAGPEGGSLVQWVSIEEGAKLAASSGKPIMYDFTAEWCPPCHVLEAEVFQNAALAKEINERFVPVRVMDRQQEEGRNSPAVAELQQRYEVMAFPTVVVADASGVVRARMEGFRGRISFERMMAQAAE